MFSPDSNAWIFNGDLTNDECRNAFRHPLVAVKMGGETDLSDCHMNPPPKRGKYSMIVDDDGETVGTSELLKEGWKQCDYVSNRARLRCQNVRKPENLKEYGFCEEHRGFIERIRKEGLRAKHCFDPSFNSCQNLHLTDDIDETLLPKHPADFPFVYESLYCDNRIDDNDNPLSRANVFTKREIAKQYVSALRRQDASIQQMRIIYQEKHRRTLHQIMELRGKSHLTKLNSNRDSQKIKRILAMRQYLLKRHNWDRILERKLADQTAMAAASFRHKKWMEQLASPPDDVQRDVEMAVAEMVNLVDECANSSRNLNIEEMHTARRKNFMSSDAFCPPLPKSVVDILEQLRKHSDEEGPLKKITSRAIVQQNNNLTDPHGYLSNCGAFSMPKPSTSKALVDNNSVEAKTVVPVSIDDDLNPDLFLRISYPTLVDGQNQQFSPKLSNVRRWRKVDEKEDASQTCARINRPWDGTRHKGTKFAGGELENNNNTNSTNISNNNNTSGKYPLKMRTNTGIVHMLHPQTGKRSRRENNGQNNVHADNNMSYGTYQQYLSLQRLIPGPRIVKALFCRQPDGRPRTARRSPTGERADEGKFARVGHAVAGQTRPTRTTTTVAEGMGGGGINGCGCHRQKGEWNGRIRKGKGEEANRTRRRAHNTQS
ncbi:hypothetical protein niasHT_036746 [Heterodera trifolii]|uniref:Uncharacterized protein n=1 Tax=Heterodera trifolii TaxID=157864 RepID=A0ABD2J4I3_9BILA